MEPDEPGPDQAAPTSADAADDGDVAPEEAVTGMVEDERRGDATKSRTCSTPDARPNETQINDWLNRRGSLVS